MKALIINVPGNRVGEPYFVPVDDMAKSGIAKGFIIYEGDKDQLAPGCVVILLDDSYRDKRYEAQLVKLEAVERAKNGQQRYDVHFKNAVSKPYQFEGVRRQTGIKVIEYI